jgi:D-alanine--poly(phosphoribitol) ligase subunit 1
MTMEELPSCPFLRTQALLASVSSEARSTPRPPEFSLAGILVRWAARAPQAEALVAGDERLTFSELLTRAQHVAACLAELGVGKGQRVAVIGSRRADTLVAIFAVLLRAATYVPLDANAPAERLDTMLRDADVSAALSERPLARTSSSWLPCIRIEDALRIGEQAAQVAPESARAGDVAYIMYTSGSTGRPKGVPITHRQAQTFFHAHNERAGIKPGDRCLSTGPFHFDVTIMDVLLPLYYGATVVMASDLPIPSQVLAAIQHERVTHLYAVGTVLAMITGDGARLDRYDLTSLKLLQTGAEVCNARVVNAWLTRLPALSFLNSYGPTEVTVGCVSYLKAPGGSLTDSDVPIGRPHTGTTIVLCDTHGELVSEPRREGEILIGGKQVMDGYHERPEETARAFIERAGESYYRSGDWGFWDEDGNLHYAGRRDDEIKLNGHRIHLNEVRRALHEIAHVEGVLVGVIDVAGRRELAAVWSGPAEQAEGALSSLHTSASSKLSSAMRPTRWARLASFPQLPSGKADAKSVFARVERAASELGGFFFDECDGVLAPSRMEALSC